MTSRMIRYSVLTTAKAESGETVEAGRYSGTEIVRASVNASGGADSSVYVLERPGLMPVDVTNLVASGQIFVA